MRKSILDLKNLLFKNPILKDYYINNPLKLNSRVYLTNFHTRLCDILIRTKLTRIQLTESISIFGYFESEKGKGWADLEHQKLSSELSTVIYYTTLETLKEDWKDIHTIIEFLNNF